MTEGCIGSTGPGKRTGVDAGLRPTNAGMVHLVALPEDDGLDRGTPAGDDHAMETARAAAIVSIVVGAGFGIGSAVTLTHLEREGELPMTPFGFRSMSGPFEGISTSAFQALGWTLVAACTLDVVAGVWLWRGRRRGGLLSLATAPVEIVLGVGFALPFLLLGVPIRTVLVLAGRRGLR